MRMRKYYLLGAPRASPKFRRVCVSREGAESWSKPVHSRDHVSVLRALADHWVRLPSEIAGPTRADHGSLRIPLRYEGLEDLGLSLGPTWRFMHALI